MTRPQPSPNMVLWMRIALDYLHRHPGRPVSASELANVLNFNGETGDSRKRPVRTVMKFLRDRDGHKICAGCHPTNGGYWLARTGAEWRRYLEDRAKGARFEFVEIRKMRDAAGERDSGQKELFDCRMSNVE